MPSILNQAILEEYRELRERAAQCVIVDCAGLTVEQSSDLRNDLREKSLSMNTVRNRLANLAFKEQGLTGMESIFKGSTALVFGEGVDEAIVAAKTLVDFKKKAKVDSLSIKGGVFEGEVLSSDRASALAKMPTRSEMQAELVTLALSPGRRVAGCVVGPAGRIAGAVKALCEKLEGE